MLTPPICAVAHSVNPNYAAKYETDHKPEMNSKCFSGSIFPLLIEILSLETCLESLYSWNMFQGS